MEGERTSSRRRVLLALATLATATTPLPASAHQDTTTTTSPDVPPGTSPDEIIAVGEEGTVTSEYDDEEVTFWVEDAFTFESDTVGGDEITAEGVFVAVEVTARNDTDQRVTVDSEQFELVTADGYAYTTEEELMLDYRDTFWVVSLDANTKKTRFAIFDADPDSAPWWLKISAGKLDDAPPVYFALPM